MLRITAASADYLLIDEARHLQAFCARQAVVFYKSTARQVRVCSTPGMG
jgi:hypothetical protein